MIRISTGFHDKNGKLTFDNHILENSRGVPFQVMMYKSAWVVSDCDGFIPFTLEEMIDGEEVEIVGIATYS